MRRLLWFRGKDLRLHDHEPLCAGVEGGELVPLFVLDPSFFEPKRAQDWPHRLQYLLQALKELQTGLQQLGSDLLLVQGRSADLLPRLVERWNIQEVLAYRWCEPFARKRDERIARDLESLGITFRLFEGETLLPPGCLRTSQGQPFSVFTPFARKLREHLNPLAPQAIPSRLPPLPHDLELDPASIPDLDALGVARNPQLIPGGEGAARCRWKNFLVEGLIHYPMARNRMDQDGTSRISADLHFGTLSVREIWAHLEEVRQDPALSDAAFTFQNELLWREFAHHVLWDRPELLDPGQPFRAAYRSFPWRSDMESWQAWVDGQTGVPIVDAAARQLRAEGFIHNRARMIAANFLTRILLLPYAHGEAHYLKWLVDGDWANNNLNWQWSAGCGCDAQPWFRVFNPFLQAQKYDPEGHYVRRWIPELRDLNAPAIFEPWKHHHGYPPPMVDYSKARQNYFDTAKAVLSIENIASRGRVD